VLEVLNERVEQINRNRELSGADLQSALKVSLSTCERTNNIMQSASSTLYLHLISAGAKPWTAAHPTPTGDRQQGEQPASHA
jgi:hypothetical protein